MANANAPSGLTPVRHLTGRPPVANEYTIADQYNTAIYYGQLVKSTGTGRNVAVAAAAERAVGVFYGCKYPNSAGEIVFSKSWPASTVTSGAVGATAYVIDDPEVIFEIQASAGCALADIGTVADITGTSGTAATGISTQQLDSATYSASGSNQLKVLRLVPRVDNDYGTNGKVEVLINEHELRAAMTAV